MCAPGEKQHDGNFIIGDPPFTNDNDLAFRHPIIVAHGEREVADLATDMNLSPTQAGQPRNRQCDCANDGSHAQFLHVAQERSIGDLP